MGKYLIEFQDSRKLFIQLQIGNYLFEYQNSKKLLFNCQENGQVFFSSAKTSRNHLLNLQRNEQVFNQESELQEIIYLITN